MVEIPEWLKVATMLVVYQRRQAMEHFHSSASKKRMEEPRSRSPVELKKL